jgi:hypothetical protein
MTTSNDPDALRAEIEQTRSNLSQNVNALGEAVQPSNIARRQVDKAKGAAVGLKDKVMGSAEGAASTVGGKASSVGGSVSGAGSNVTGAVGNVGSNVTDTVSNAGQTAKAQTQGNPLAAGMIALGAGWLLGSLLPATSKERQATSALKEQVTPLVGQAQEVAKEAAQEAAQNLKEPAKEAAESLKSTAQDAAETVKAEGQSNAESVKSSAQDSKDSVQEHQSAPGTSL